MSVTTRTNVVSQSALQLLADYELHHSGDPETQGTVASPNPRTDLGAVSTNPPSWPTDHRRIPPYRPIDYNLDLEQRPGGLHFVESVFIATMLNGVRLNANMSRLWAATAGRLNDRIFYYKIGGEF